MKRSIALAIGFMFAISGSAADAGTRSAPVTLRDVRQATSFGQAVRLAAQIPEIQVALKGGQSVPILSAPVPRDRVDNRSRSLHVLGLEGRHPLGHSVQVFLEAGKGRIFRRPTLAMSIVEEALVSKRMNIADHGFSRPVRSIVGAKTVTAPLPWIGSAKSALMEVAPLAARRDVVRALRRHASPSDVAAMVARFLDKQAQP